MSDEMNWFDQRIQEEKLALAETEGLMQKLSNQHDVIEKDANKEEIMAVRDTSTSLWLKRAGINDTIKELERKKRMAPTQWLLKQANNHLSKNV